MVKLNDFSSLSEMTLSSVVNSTIPLSAPDGCVLKQGSHVVPWDNEDSLISKQAEIIVNILVTGVCLPLCFLVSFFCNTVNMVVFCKQGLKERINMLLFSLSLLDLIYVAATYGYQSDVLYMFVVGRENEIRPTQAFLFNHHVIGLIGTGAASQVVSSLIALERCLCITRPLLVKTLMSTKKTATVLWTFLLLVMAGVFFACMRYSVRCVFDASKNSTFLQFFPSEIYLRNQRIMFILDAIVYGSALPAACVVCVFVCTVIIVVKMKKLSSWRETVSSASDSLSSRDLALTRMIVGTSVLFIVCIVPSMMVRILLFVTPDLRLGGRYENLYSVLLRIFHISSVMNSSFNFFVYYAFGTKFRQTVFQLFLSCGCSKKAQTEHK